MDVLEKEHISRQLYSQSLHSDLMSNIHKKIKLTAFSVSAHWFVKLVVISRLMYDFRYRVKLIVATDIYAFVTHFRLFSTMSRRVLHQCPIYWFLISFIHLDETWTLGYTKAELLVCFFNNSWHTWSGLDDWLKYSTDLFKWCFCSLSSVQWSSVPWVKCSTGDELMSNWLFFFSWADRK